MAYEQGTWPWVTWADALTERLAGTAQGWHISDLLEGAGASLNKSNEVLLARELRRRFWMRRKAQRNGVVGYYWWPPVEQSTASMVR